MKGKLPRVSFGSKRSHTPSIQALIVIFITLFVLFLWLNFGLTQQIELIGREIQVKTQDLKALEQEGDAYKQEISEEGSQRNMSKRARVLGYEPQAPHYLLMTEPLVEPESEAPVPAEQSSTLTSSEGGQAHGANNLWLLLTGRSVQPDSATAP